MNIGQQPDCQSAKGTLQNLEGTSRIWWLYQPDIPAAAERFGLALLEKVKLLREHPMLGRVVPERGQANMREIIHPPYRVIYRMREREQIVEVLRFWHSARGKIELGK